MSHQLSDSFVRHLDTIKELSLPKQTHNRQHRQDCFKHHSVIPCALSTHVQIGQVSAQFGKVGVGKVQHLLGSCLDQMLKCAAAINIDCDYIPIYNQAELIQKQTGLVTDNPTLVRGAFLANLLSGPSFTPRMNQLEIVTIIHINRPGSAMSCFDPC